MPAVLLCKLGSFAFLTLSLVRSAVHQDPVCPDSTWPPRNFPTLKTVNLASFVFFCVQKSELHLRLSYACHFCQQPELE